jgi:hypothetical protein
MNKIILLFLLIPTLSSRYAAAQSLEKNLSPDHPQIYFRASEKPDRVILTPSGSNGELLSVTWRTAPCAGIQKLQFAEPSTDPDFFKSRSELTATTIPYLGLEKDSANYHTVQIPTLDNSKKYAYRVGSGEYWSEWLDIFPSTLPRNEFEFIFLGDAQNDVHPLWSRVIRSAYRQSPKASFFLHVGDLINHSQNDYEWAEWFEAGGSILSSIPQIAIPGNHEYIKNEEGIKLGITPIWDLQFNFPSNHPKGFKDRSYFVDYQNLKIICLDSNDQIENQVPWLEEVLSQNQKEWVIVMLHHPVIPGSERGENEGVLKNWKPIFDKYKVDLVLQGHDHVYARGNNVNSGLNLWEEDSGTVYVVAVSGRKMYPLGNHSWMDKKAAELQTYQVISIKESSLTFKAYSLDDKLFDAFEIVKRENEKNLFKNLLD